jgi:5-methylcytosine-specific restriction endonuclease McrA
MLIHNYQALKLDASYRPVDVIPAVEALVSTMMGKTTVLETYEQTISSPNLSFRLPAVVVLKKVVKKGGSFACDRKHVYIRDKGCCQYCGKNLTKTESTLDHVVPKSQGGIISWDNVVLSCFDCNQKKGSRTPEQANMKLRKQPKFLTYAEYLAYMNFDIDAWKDYF